MKYVISGEDSIVVNLIYFYPSSSFLSSVVVTGVAALPPFRGSVLTLSVLDIVVLTLKTTRTIP